MGERLIDIPKKTVLSFYSFTFRILRPRRIHEIRKQPLKFFTLSILKNSIYNGAKLDIRGYSFHFMQGDKSCKEVLCTRHEKRACTRIYVYLKAELFA